MCTVLDSCTQASTIHIHRVCEIAWNMPTFLFGTNVTFSSWAVMSSRLKLEARAGLPWCPGAALMVPAGDARVLLLLLLAPLLPPPPLTLLLLPAPPLLPPAACCLLLRPAGGFWRTCTHRMRISCSIITVFLKKTSSGVHFGHIEIIIEQRWNVMWNTSVMQVILPLPHLHSVQVNEGKPLQGSSLVKPTALSLGKNCWALLFSEI